MKTARLKPGDPVAVVAISGPVARHRLDRGIDRVESWGHPVIGSRSLLARHGFLAGRDEARAFDMNAVIDRPDIPGIFFARGGWGAARILDRIDLEALRRRPRVLLGFSDLTSLFMALQRPGHSYPVRYGPTVVQLGDPRAFHSGSLREALYLEEPLVAHPLGGGPVLRAGRGSGTLIGGCLSLLVGLMGTPYDTPWDGCLLFWEDVNEEPYAIDRMLNQLRLAGKLKGLAGMIVGRLQGCRPAKGTRGLPLAEIVRDATAGTSYPIVLGFPAGHAPGKRTLLLGAPAILDTRRGRLESRIA